MKKISKHEHKLLAIWAADCAEHVLLSYEKNHPGDKRPREAIEAARLWGRGAIKINEARKFAYAALASARNTVVPKAVAAARSAGHAAATAHVPAHAKYAALYAVKAAPNPKKEKKWQLQCLPEHLKEIILDNYGMT